MANEALVLVIEDEQGIRRFLRAAFPEDEFKLIEAETGKQGMQMTATQNPRVVLLDLGLPDVDGIEVIKQIREWSPVPIIILSAREREEEKVAALDAGANDYLTKPFGVAELLARIRVALRVWQVAPDKSGFEFGNLKVDFASREVFKRGAAVHLTPIEYQLLLCLIRHPGRVLTHKQIMTEVWGSAYARETHYLRVFMRSLRNKLEDDPSQPALFVTETGVGYRFKG